MSNPLENISCIERGFHNVSQIISSLKQKGHGDNGVTLLAISKKVPVEMMRHLWSLGQKDFGENQVQEAMTKYHQLHDLKDIIWHFVGKLQSNKTRQISECFSWVHSIDRLKIAERLNEQRPDGLDPLNVCIQVNISDEQAKNGIQSDDVFSMSESIISLNNLHLRGLMVVPKNSDDKEEQRNTFKSMYGLFTMMQERYPYETIDTLSMGMSKDYIIAIEEGATMVRVGTALFGSR